jgi:hypothetical protein
MQCSWNSKLRVTWCGKSEPVPERRNMLTFYLCTVLRILHFHVTEARGQFESGFLIIIIFLFGLNWCMETVTS